MKKEKIDGYEVYSEDGELKKVIFKDYEGNEVCIGIENCLKIEFLQRRKEVYSERYKKRKHIDKYVHDDWLLELKTSRTVVSPEEIIMSREGENRIIREIWNLPSPQNRRVYMYIVNQFSLTKISKIEKRSVSAIKQSIDIGLKNLQKKLKKF